jgi:hypothetical protein
MPWRKCFPIHEIGRIDGGRGFRTGKKGFRIGGNTFYDRKNKIPMKILESKRSEIGKIAEFRGIPNGFPNLAYVPILGRGTAIFILNGKRILVRNVLHVPGLAVLLYSHRTHITQQGCGFVGTWESEFLVYFPTFVLSVNTAVDCHLSFDPLDRSAPLATLHYVQPRCPPAVYPSEVSPSTSTAAPSPASPVMIEDDNVATLPSAEHPILTSSVPSSAVSLHALLMHIKSLTDAVNHLTSSSSHTPQPHSSPTPRALDVNKMPATDSDDAPASCLLSTVSSEEITCLLHHPCTSFPSV